MTKNNYNIHQLKNLSSLFSKVISRTLIEKVINYYRARNKRSRNNNKNNINNINKI